MKRAGRRAGAALVLAALAAPAHAAGPAFCRNYVDHVMAQVLENQAKDCKFSGDRWGTSEAGHMRYCRSVDEDAAREERRKRDIQFVACRDCSEYAREAVALARENLVYECGGTGPTWGTNRDAHYLWCVNQGYWGIHGESGALGKIIPGLKENATTEQDRRVTRVYTCKNRFSESQRAKCVVYADAGERDARAVAALPNQCGVALAGRWSSNRDEHHAWCIQKLRSGAEGEIDSESAARTTLIASCRDASADYGACPGCGSDVLRPEPSRGPSPFGSRPSGGGSTGTGGVVARPNRPGSDYATRPDPNTCKSGFVWRLARPSDLVCVTPEARERTSHENTYAANRVDPNGAYGPNTCLAGFVWREAFEGDLVCVPPETRAAVRRENAEAANRRAGP